MTGVTGLRPLTNDPVGPQKQKNGTLDDPSTTTLNAHESDIVKAKGTYVRDSTHKTIAENDEYSDDETVKTANSSTFNADSTIETETLYDNDDDDQSKIPGVTEWIPVTGKILNVSNWCLQRRRPRKMSPQLRHLLKIAEIK